MNRTIKDVIKDNKKEIIVFGGSALMLGIGVVCLTKSAKMNIKIDKFLNAEPFEFVDFDDLKQKPIKAMCATLEYMDGEIGMINVNSPGILDEIFALIFPHD